MQKAGESRPFLLLKEEALFFQYDLEDAETMGVMPNDSSRRKKAGLIGAPSLVLSGASNEISRENLLNTIYQAALVPEEWSSVLSQMSMAADAKGGLLFTTHLDRIQWTASPELKPLFAAFIRDGWRRIAETGYILSISEPMRCSVKRCRDCRSPVEKHWQDWMNWSENDRSESDAARNI